MRLLGLATTAPVAAAPLLAQVERGAPARAEKPLKVIIAGAGMAGLCAAYELEKLGHECVILEADSSHLGGRVRTLRLPDGMHGEAGAMRIPEKHHLTRHYLTELGVGLRSFVYGNDNAYYFVRGKKLRIRDVDGLRAQYALTEAEKKLTPDDIWKKTVVSRLEQLGDAGRAELLSPELKSPALRGLDQQSLQQLFEQDGFSAEAIEMLAVTYGQEAIMGSAATEHLREDLEKVWSLSFDEIPGGTDMLAKAFVERLKSKPRTGCEITRLEQDGARGRVSATYVNRAAGGAEETVEGDHLICTLPCPVLGRIHLPGLSGPKKRAIRQVIYDSSTKVLAVTKRRFWETDDGIYGGGTFTDLPTATTYYPADNAKARDPEVSARPSVFLASYSWGQQARRLGALEAGMQRQVVMSQLGQVHPQLLEPGMVQRTVGWSWDRHPWSGGAFAWFAPGQHTALYPDLIAPEGRIHFAGEHASLGHTWIQGAFESALRAIKEIRESARS